MVAIWPSLKQFARNKMVLQFGYSWNFFNAEENSTV